MVLIYIFSLLSEFGAERFVSYHVSYHTVPYHAMSYHAMMTNVTVVDGFVFIVNSIFASIVIARVRDNHVMPNKQSI